MKKKRLWSADSTSFLYMTALFLVPTLIYAFALVFSFSLFNLACFVLYFSISMLAFLLLVKTRKLEEFINLEIERLGFSAVLGSTVPDVKRKDFLGFNVDGVYYSADIGVDGGYKVETFTYPNCPVTLYEYRFLDSENSFLVVFNRNEPPTRGGVAVFVK